MFVKRFKLDVIFPDSMTTLLLGNIENVITNCLKYSLKLFIFLIKANIFLVHHYSSAYYVFMQKQYKLDFLSMRKKVNSTKWQSTERYLALPFNYEAIHDFEQLFNWKTLRFRWIVYFWYQKGSIFLCFIQSETFVWAVNEMNKTKKRIVGNDTLSGTICWRQKQSLFSTFNHEKYGKWKITSKCKKKNKV